MKYGISLLGRFTSSQILFISSHHVLYPPLNMISLTSALFSLSLFILLPHHPLSAYLLANSTLIIRHLPCCVTCSEALKGPSSAMRVSGGIKKSGGAERTRKKADLRN
jgi:hypothetical protein